MIIIIHSSLLPHRVSGVGGEHDGVVAQDVNVVRGPPHPGDLLRSWLLVCHESKCVIILMPPITFSFPGHFHVSLIPFSLLHPRLNPGAQ